MKCADSGPRSHRRGGALLAGLWLTAALSAIAFSVANTVRGETERASTAIDGLRGYYLAAGAVERATLYMLWGSGPKNPDGSTRFYEKGMSRLYFAFPGGDAQVEIIPATAKLNVNSASPEQLFNLLLAVGAEPERAEAIATGIEEWRSPRGPRRLFEQQHLSRESSFQARHASFEEIEEVLLVRGMTPELFYGNYVRGPQGGLVRRSGLRDCLSVYGSTGPFDANAADPALLVSLGMDPAA
ncbi:MAG: general secretion pathway protein GspK, partial [bacterium]|nr:general secretion pathway protein GspK [bacterium]